MWAPRNFRPLAKASIPALTWRDPLERPIDVLCPNCGSAAVKTLVLTVRWQTLDQPVRESELLYCAACSCRFYRDQRIPDYAAPGLLDYGRVSFYVHQGAGRLARRGIDPSALSELGRRLLGVDINLGYLHEQDRRAEHDIEMSAEAIEHVLSPLAFVHALRGNLKPDGVLVLTTPDTDRITRATSPATLVGLLSQAYTWSFKVKQACAHCFAERALRMS